MSKISRSFYIIKNKEYFFIKKLKNLLTKCGCIGYNVECHCVKAYSTAESETLPIYFKGGANDAQNLSTEKASEKKGTRL